MQYIIFNNSTGLVWSETENGWVEREEASNGSIFNSLEEIEAIKTFGWWWNTGFIEIKMVLSLK